MAKPAKPTVPPPPLRSNPDTFSARMEASLVFWKTFADYLDELGSFSEAQADAALAAALAAGTGTGLALKGNGGKVMAVNAGATALEFLTASGAGKAILASASPAGLALASDADAAAQRATLGLGTVTMLAEAVTDLNAITRSGWNRFAASQTTNAPFATGAGMVLTIFYDGAAAVQLVWAHNKGESDTGQWIRWRASSAWGRWVRLYGSDSEILGLVRTPGVTAATTSGTAFDLAVAAAATEIIVDLIDVSLSGTDAILLQIGTAASVYATGYSGAGIALWTNGAASTSVAGMPISPSGNWVSRGVTGQARIVRASPTLVMMTFTGICRDGLAILSKATLAISEAEDITRVRVTRSGSNTFNGGAVKAITRQ